MPRHITHHTSHITDIQWMSEALRLAQRGRGRVSPNPLVGCVLVKSGRKIGRGYHAYFGGPHAEAMALQNAGSLARGSTAYVNLEPCRHWGKTPPCAQALIAAGVRRVVAAMKDPNPVSQGGLLELRAAGIQVSIGVLERQALRLNRPFLTNILQKRPYVILKAAASLDGKISTATGESRWITSLKARRLSHKLRGDADAVLVGINTVLRDDPSLTSHGQGRDPVRVVLDTDLKTPLGANVLKRGPMTLIATSRSGFSKAGRFRKSGIPIIPVPRKNGGLDLRCLLAELNRMGIGILLVEGGAAVHTSFLNQGLADEARVFLAPKLIGGEKAKTFFEGPGISCLDKALSLHEPEIRKVGPDILISGFLNTVNGKR